VYTGTNPGYTSYEITHHVKTSHAKFIICEPDLLQPMLEAKHDVPRERIFVFDNLGQPIPDGFKGWKSLLEHGEMDWYVLLYAYSYMRPIKIVSNGQSRFRNSALIRPIITNAL
jgi:hypothetical protein